MRTWFPFTDYDFYAYLTSGLILVATFDLAFFGGELVYQESWTFVQGVFWTIVCYLIGHVVAGLSSLILQQLAFSGLFLSPEAIVLDLKGQGFMNEFSGGCLPMNIQGFPSTYRESFARNWRKKPATKSQSKRIGKRSFRRHFRFRDTR